MCHNIFLALYEASISFAFYPESCCVVSQLLIMIFSDILCFIHALLFLVKRVVIEAHKEVVFMLKY